MKHPQITGSHLDSKNIKIHSFKLNYNSQNRWKMMKNSCIISWNNIPFHLGCHPFFLETNIKLRVRSVQSKVHGYLSWDQASVNKQLSGLMSLVCLIYLQSTGRGVTHFSNCSDFNLYSTPEFCKSYQYVPHQDQICQQKSTHSRFGEKNVGSKSGAAGIWNVLSADILSPRISLATLVLGYSICPLRICGSWLPSLHHTDPSATATANQSLKPQNSEHYPPQQVAMICNAYILVLARLEPLPRPDLR